VLRAFENRLIENSIQITQNVLQQIDAYIKELNQMSRNFINDSNIQAKLKEISQKQISLTDYEKLIFDRFFGNYSYYIVSLSTLNPPNVYIFSKVNNYKFSYGSLNLTPKFELLIKNRRYKQEILEGNVITYFINQNNELYKDAEVPSIGIIRPFSDIYGNIYSFIEIQEDYSQIENICSTYSSNKVYILDENGNIVYPLHKISKFEKQVLNKENLNTKDFGFFGSKGKYYSFARSFDTGLRVVIQHSTISLFSSLYTLRNTTIVIIFLLCFLSIIAVYGVTTMLTRPIRELRDTILKFDYKNMSIEIPKNTYNNEISLLNHAFNTMIQRLKLSVENELKLKEEEMKARLSALQAQIAPHFIHNILYLISISAQENKIDEVITMCKKLSDMLRYVAASPFQPVTLEEEINHVNNYLTFLQKKYEDFLLFKIEVSGNAKIALIPRLSIQPFVENTIHHAFNKKEPPWFITIRSSIDENKNLLKIWIEDNGCGFDENVLSEVNYRVNEVITLDNFQVNSQFSSQIGGMGIVNTVIRLKLFFGKDLDFEIKSQKAKGTIINISVPFKAKT
jgi:two-component system sensor histidine kinase YesM